LASDTPRLENAIGLFVDLYHCKSLDFGPLKDWQLFPPWLLAFTRLDLWVRGLSALLLNDRRSGTFESSLCRNCCTTGELYLDLEILKVFPRQISGPPEIDVHLLMAGGAQHHDDHPRFFP
jgi:hypothetical protein